MALGWHSRATPIFFFISYVFPGLTQNVWLDQNFVISTTLTNTFLGTLLLYVFAAISGRVISDLKIVEEKLHRQNVELKETNQELDRFVYSVSHDLSAPLKSILGLVNISKLSDDPNDHKSYFKKIEASVIKLSVFIKEVLDYSYNKRLVLTLESIQLRELCDENSKVLALKTDCAVIRNPKPVDWPDLSCRKLPVF